MKKNIITAGIIAVIAIVAFLNVNVALKSEKSNSLVDITLTDVEALAETELAETEWNHILDWLTNGLRKDEKIRETSCSQTNTSSTTTTTTSPSTDIYVYTIVNGVLVKVKVSAGGTTITNTNHSDTNVPNGTKISCGSGGNVNCDPCECC